MANLQHLSIYKVTKDSVTYDALFMQCTVDKNKKWLILPVEIKKAENKNELDEYNIRYCNNSDYSSETCFVVEDDNISEINKKYQITISDESKGKISINNSYDVKDRLKKIKFFDLKRSNNDTRVSYENINVADLTNHLVRTTKVEIIFKEIKTNTKEKERNLEITNNEVSVTYEKNTSEVSSMEKTQVSEENKDNITTSLNAESFQRTLATNPNGQLIDKNQKLQEENENLKEQIISKTAECNNLSTSLETEKQRSQKLEEENKELTSQLQTVQNTIKSLNETNAKNEEKIVELEAKITDLNILVQKKEKIEKLNEKIILNLKTKTDLKKQISGLRQKHIEYIEENDKNQKIIKKKFSYKIIKILTFGIWKSKKIKSLKEEKLSRTKQLEDDINEKEKSIFEFESLIKQDEFNITSLKKDNKRTQNLQDLSNLNDSWKEASNSSRERSIFF
ncbi:hypothetical protein [Spiroplasma endosymbiont of Virgichneumon dumeticola]|uniref:hypothetical protein n=1 Tax=Spiroplasma endosymbiont of Virgichneumon dumeticola TaxID=3139323 RepID=UPI0035C89FB1